MKNYWYCFKEMFVEISWNSKWNFNQYLFNFDDKLEKRGNNSTKYHWNLNVIFREYLLKYFYCFTDIQGSSVIYHLNFNAVFQQWESIEFADWDAILSAIIIPDGDITTEKFRTWIRHSLLKRTFFNKMFVYLSFRVISGSRPGGFQFPEYSYLIRCLQHG